MRILILGSGGREHALLYALKRSKHKLEIFIAPGNGGTEEFAKNVSLPLEDNKKIVEWCKKEKIDLVIIGPELPLVNGIVDELEAAQIKAFGPSKKAARLEGSKIFMKKIAEKYNIPTAKFAEFFDAEKAKKFATEIGFPLVVKADGLAAGKGVIIAQNKQEADEAIDEMLVSKKFGEAGCKIIIEEFLEGEEVSVFALVDGKNGILFGAAQDHKRAFDDDKGPNTGGMGTYSPAPIFTKELEKEVMEKIINPTISAMTQENAPYKGILFAGIMVTKKGAKLLEFNVRFGDPETQVLMMLLESDLVDHILAVCDGDISQEKIIMSKKSAICVVMAAKGYPGEYKKNTIIENISEASAIKDVFIFHAATKKEENGKFSAQGGRVLGVTSIAEDVKLAREAAYKAVGKIKWDDGFFRKDIGWRAI